MARKVHEFPDGVCCISENDFWLAGNYIDRATAERAFDLPDDTLQRLQDEINSIHRGNRPITMDDLTAAQP